MISQSSCGTLANVWDLIIATAGSEAGPENKLVSNDYFKSPMFEYDFKDIFPMVYDTPVRHLRNETQKCSKLNENGVIIISIW